MLWATLIMINNVGHIRNIEMILWVHIVDQPTLYKIGGPKRQMMAFLSKFLFIFHKQMTDLAKYTLVFGYDKQPRNNHGI
jgi:hypothetical protein